MALYIWIISVHRLSNLREIFAAMHVWTLPVVDGYPRCRHVNSTHYLCLPNTFLIGASKCGTTTLIEFLRQQPNVALVSRRITVVDHHREIHRFDRATYPYAFHFLELADEWASSPVVSDPSTIVIHYTPHYLYSPTVPFSMRSFYPIDKEHKLKFVIMLRDPVERALSAYWFAHSHLFSYKNDNIKRYGDVPHGQSNAKTDSGSINEFAGMVMEQMGARHAHEKCMQQQQDQAQSQSFGSAQSFSSTPSVAAFATRMYEALSHCFRDSLRSSTLGVRHVDKGIYVDQLQRWYLNFLPTDATTAISTSTSPSGSSASGISASARDSDKAALRDDYSIESVYFISTLEDMKHRPAEMLQQLLNFLYTTNDISTSNKFKSMATPRPVLPSEGYLSQPNSLSELPENQISEELRKALKEFYQPYMKQLEVLLNKYPVVLTKGVIMEMGS